MISRPKTTISDPFFTMFQPNNFQISCAVFVVFQIVLVYNKYQQINLHDSKGDFMADYKYSQISAWIRSQIKSGAFQAGDKIPTELELAEQFKISRDTVRAGISHLERDGLLTRKKGSGTYVTAADTSCNFLRSKSRKILVIMAETENYIFPSIINGINQELSKYGYSAAVQFTSGHFQTERHLLKHVLEGDYAGAIIEPVKSGLPNMNLDLYQKLACCKPAVLLHARFDLPHLSFVTSDDKESGYQLTRYLIEQGHRDIAYFCKLDEQPGHARYQGYLRAFMETGTKLVEDNILCFVSEDLPYLFGHPINPRTLNVLKRCSAVICHDDRLACKLHSFCIQQHINVAIAGFDNSTVAKSICCATIAHPQEALGKAAASSLLQKIEAPALDTSVIFPPELVVRADKTGKIH